jgi:pimeloyl-ACP methyl ester carboxylesterase
LIHGWSPNGKPAPPGGGGWSNFRSYLSNDSQLHRHFKPYLVRYWSNAVSINEIAAQLRNAMESNGLHEKKVILLVHSMGGLVARSYMNEHAFRSGRYANRNCGDLVKLLITLGSPHHGSPMANGPARDAKVNLLLKIALTAIETAAFRETRYNEVNRSDMRWDNYDRLFDYQKFSDEKNTWLENLNKLTLYDDRTIAYVASAQGKFLLPPYANNTEEYQMSTYLINASFGFENDGIVPVQSGSFEGHNLKSKRFFSGYNHSEINIGKNGDKVLFDSLKLDLMPYAPLALVQPVAENIFIKGGSTYSIKWNAPVDIRKINVFFSADNGLTYEPVAYEVPASSGIYNWTVPLINTKQGRIRIENANDNVELDTSLTVFTVYNNDLAVESPTQSKFFIWKQPNTIEWTQSGLGNWLRIKYLNEQTDTERIIADSVHTSSGSNSYSWNIDNTFVPTENGRLVFELTDMADRYGDTTSYRWMSENFTLYGDVDIKIHFPVYLTGQSKSVGHDQLMIDETYSSVWETEGALSYIDFYLADSMKNKIRFIGRNVFPSRLKNNGHANLKMPEYFGDSIYLLAEAGFGEAPAQVSSLSEYPFQLNRLPEIKYPITADKAVPIVPCFEIEPTGKASSYSFELLNNNNTIVVLSGTDPLLCLTNNAENELLPGTTYTLNAWEWYQEKQSYMASTTFTTGTFAPEPFTLLTPTQGKQMNDSLITVRWSRSVGAAAYQLELIHNRDTLYHLIDLGKNDTVQVLDLGYRWHPDTLRVRILALNPYGQSEARSYFFNEFKANYPHYEHGPGSLFHLTVYPNPFSESTNIVFTLPQTTVEKHVRLSVYNANGQKLETLIDRPLRGNATHQFHWKPNNSIGEKTGRSICFFLLSVDGQTESVKAIAR